MLNDLCFAYGSNLNFADLADHARKHGRAIPQLEFYCRATLPDHCLSFPRYSIGRKGGALSVKQALGCVVEGVLFKVKTEEDWNLLDRKENVAGARGVKSAAGSYTRETVTLIQENGSLISGQTYIAIPDSPERHVAPHADYLEVVHNGYREIGIDYAAVDAAAARGQPKQENGFFFYGTLMREQPRFPLLREFGIGCCILAEADGQLVDLGHYPAFKPDSGDREVVHGEFVRLRDSVNALKRLDRIEGFNGYGAAESLYHRTLIYAHVGEGRFRRGWTYRSASEHLDFPVISTGSWRKHKDVENAFLRKLVSEHTRDNQLQVLQTLANLRRLRGQACPELANCSHEYLFDALRTGNMSERQLAQASGKWTVGS